MNIKIKIDDKYVAEIDDIADLSFDHRDVTPEYVRMFYPNLREKHLTAYTLRFVSYEVPKGGEVE